MTCSATTPATPLAVRGRKEACVTHAAPGAPPGDLASTASGDSGITGPAGQLDIAEGPLAYLARLASRVAALCSEELRNIRHDRTELYTLAIQPTLGLLFDRATYPCAP